MNFIVSHRWPGGMNTLEMALLLAVVTMPFDFVLNSYAIVLFAAAALLSNSPWEKIKRLRKHAFFWIFPVSYFAWMAITLLWDKGSTRSASVVQDLERSVSWFVFPILFISIERIKPESVKKILFAFVTTNLLASFYCLWKSYLEYKTTNYINLFFYYHLSKHINISAIYFAMYCVFSIYILFYYLLFQKRSGWVRLGCLFITAYLTFFVVILSSKTMIFLLYISALVFTVYSFHYFRSKWGALIMSVLLVAMPVLLVKFPYVNARVRDTQIKEYRGTGDDQNGLAVRGVLWESSWNLISVRPVLGWGHYGARDVLQKKYLEMGFKEGARENYNSHNQYLYTWLCYGLIGLSIFLIYSGSLLYFFSRNKNVLGICLLLLFILANVTECMLEVQKGIVFFFLFGNLFLFHSANRKSRHPQQEDYLN
jgi:O-antigen ligase